jgi:hypothetical protein
MPKIERMTSCSFRWPDFEGSLAFRGDSPVGAVGPHKDIANEIVITLGTRNDWSIEAVKDLPILQPPFDQKLERSPIVYVIASIFFCHFNVNIIPGCYSYSNPNARQSLHRSNGTEKGPDTFSLFREVIGDNAAESVQDLFPVFVG